MRKLILALMTMVAVVMGQPTSQQTGTPVNINGHPLQPLQLIGRFDNGWARATDSTRVGLVAGDRDTVVFQVNQSMGYFYLKFKPGIAADSLAMYWLYETNPNAYINPTTGAVSNSELSGTRKYVNLMDSTGTALAGTTLATIWGNYVYYGTQQVEGTTGMPLAKYLYLIVWYRGKTATAVTIQGIRVNNF